MTESLEERVLELRARDARYARNAYYFVLEALDYTLSRPPGVARGRHVGGRELLAGIRDLARERYGAMAREVFEQWGIRATEDFGQVVFNLVSVGLLQRRPQDTLADFEDGFDFARVFEEDYRPRVPGGELQS